MMATASDTNPIASGIETFDWAGFVERCWDKTPALFKDPFGGPLVRLQDIFWMLVDQGDAVRRGASANVVLFDRDRRGLTGGGPMNRYMKDLAERLPAADDGSMEGYVARLAREERHREFGIYFDNAHAYERAYKGARAILRELYRFVPLRSSPLNIDVFLGNYRSTSFGVHRDPLDNIMIMVEGSKTMRLWSDETWKGKLGNPSHDGHTTHDYARFLPDALTFTLEPGDMLYWPHTWWHVGENDGGFSASMNIDFKVRPPAGAIDSCVEGALQSALTQARRKGGGAEPPADAAFDPTDPQRAAEEIPDALIESLQAALSAFGGADHQTFLHSRWLMKLSSFGFASGPMRRAPRELAPGDRLASDARFPILRAEAGGRLLLSHSGHLKIARPTGPNRALIEALNGGGEWAVGEILDRCAGAEDGTPERLRARDEMQSLLSELFQIHALDLKTA